MSLLLVVACSDGVSSEGPDADVLACYQEPTRCVDPDGAHVQFVVDSIVMPTSATHAQMLGVDVDGDPDGRPDNALGQILAALARQGGVDLRASADEAVAAGTTITLIDLQTADLSDAPNAGAWVLLGADPMPAPCADAGDSVCGRHLGGDARFAVDPETPPASLLPGTLTDGRFRGGPGRIAVDLPVGDRVLRLHLIGARVEAVVTGGGLVEGRLGGAITQEQLQNDIIPTVWEVMFDAIGEDCPNTEPPCCIEGTTGETLIDLFDVDDDCMLELSELDCSGLGCYFLAPDLDLLDENGNFNPRHDLVKDSLSLGVGFTAVPAVFPEPAP